jgi:VWFA-related protein
MKDFVDREMQPGDLVSIMTTSGGMGALEQLTNDKRVLYAAIARIMYSPSRNQLGESLLDETVMGPKVGYDFAHADRALAALRQPRLAAGATSALGYAIQALREMPGRKAVALFSAGFGGSTPAIVEMANRSSVVVYTFDMRGIIATYDAHLPPGYFASQGSLDLLARSTGGVFYRETNGFGAALATALDDMSSYYLIGYQPQREDFDLVHGVPRFHKIQVKVLRPGLTVRSRDGFMGEPDAPESGAPAVSANARGKELWKSMMSPFRASELPVYLSAFYAASAGGAKKTGRLQTTLRTLLVIDGRALQPADAEAGKKKLVLDVVAGIWGESDRPITSVDKRFTIEKTPEDLRRSMAAGLAVEIDVPVPRPGAYQLRSAVREPDSGQGGSATAFVDIPDFNRRRLALSSVILSDRDPARTEALERKGVIAAGSPATRVFAPGAVLSYDCTIYGALTDKQTAKPRIDIEIRLFNGPKQIFAGHPIPLAIPDGMPPAVHAAGEIRLPATLPPGDYAVELIAWDRLEKAQSHATQFVDFTLVK